MERQFIIDVVKFLAPMPTYTRPVNIGCTWLISDHRWHVRCMTPKWRDSTPIHAPYTVRWFAYIINFMGILGPDAKQAVEFLRCARETIEADADVLCELAEWYHSRRGAVDEWPRQFIMAWELLVAVHKLRGQRL